MSLFHILLLQLMNLEYKCNCWRILSPSTLFVCFSLKSSGISWQRRKIDMPGSTLLQKATLSHPEPWPGAGHKLLFRRWRSSCPCTWRLALCGNQPWTSILDSRQFDHHTFFFCCHEAWSLDEHSHVFTFCGKRGRGCKRQASASEATVKSSPKSFPRNVHTVANRQYWWGAHCVERKTQLSSVYSFQASKIWHQDFCPVHVCEDSGYMHNFIVYVGKDNTTLAPTLVKNLRSSGAVVAKLMSKLQGKATTCTLTTGTQVTLGQVPKPAQDGNARNNLLKPTGSSQAADFLLEAEEGRVCLPKRGRDAGGQTPGHEGGHVLVNAPPCRSRCNRKARPTSTDRQWRTQKGGLGGSPPRKFLDFQA